MSISVSVMFLIGLDLIAAFYGCLYVGKMFSLFIHCMFCDYCVLCMVERLCFHTVGTLNSGNIASVVFFLAL